MKKFSILFVVLAVVCLTCAAFAQENDFSEYLGVWYTDSSCAGKVCIPTFMTGSQGELEIRDNFTATIKYSANRGGLNDGEDNALTGQWYTENDII